MNDIRYHFEEETRVDRLKIRAKLAGKVALSLIFIYSLFCVGFIISSHKQNDLTDKYFYKRTPDLIVVFTGDTGRIKYAIKKAKELDIPHIFVSGVNAKNSVNTILKHLNIKEKIDTNYIDIDYLARNTVENVLSTYRYLDTHPEMRKVMVISHDYHLMRVKLLVNKLGHHGRGADFFYYGIETNYKKLRNLKLLYKEVFKLIRAWGFITLLDPENEYRAAEESMSVVK